MASQVPDLFDYAKRTLSRAAAQALDRAIEAAAQAARRAVQDRVDDLAASIEYFSAVLGQMAHGAANAVADSFRGGAARTLTKAEADLINGVFGNQPVTTDQVRFVNGPGRQPLAATAFLKGNPAITIGNTVYVKADHYLAAGGADWTGNTVGMELLFHEYVHVLQWAKLGFGRFGKRYAQEFKKAGGDPAVMYAYQSRDLHYRDEMLEGQAAMVGDWAEQWKTDPSARNQALIQQIREKLRGTGIFGH